MPGNEPLRVVDFHVCLFVFVPEALAARGSLKSYASSLLFHLSQVRMVSRRPDRDHPNWWWNHTAHVAQNPPHLTFQDVGEGCHHCGAHTKFVTSGKPATLIQCVDPCK